MANQRWDTVEALFSDLHGIEGEDLERELSRRCGSNSELQAQLRRLIKASTGADRYFAGFSARLGIAAPEAEGVIHAPGTRLGAWRVVRQLGRGGMGVVYEAERGDGEFIMRAAFKVVPVDLLSREAKARFHREREILARLDHPNIARLMDGGITPEGTPYLVMEFVKGEPIDVHCNRLQLGLHARLELILEAAEALDHAHRRRVVHCDVKPANILVNPEGRVRLVDFGIAAAIDAGDPRPRAKVEQFCSPAYAAPEQLAGTPPAVAQDVFGLGAVLFKLLAGFPPRGETDGAPSITPGMAGAAGAPSRLMQDEHGLPVQSSRVRGDLDAICLKALSLVPERRYAGTDALAEDIRAFLNGRPVRARAGGRGYRARRFFGRHLVAASLAGLAVAALVGGSAVALWQANEARQQARVAEDAAQRALAQAERATVIREFLLGTLQTMPPSRLPTRDQWMRGIAAEMARRTGISYANPTWLEAELLTVIGRLYRRQGLYPEAQQMVKQAANLALQRPASDPEQTVYSLYILGLVHFDEGRLELAGELFEQAWGWAERSDDVSLETRVLLATDRARLAMVKPDTSPLPLTILDVVQGEVATSTSLNGLIRYIYLDRRGRALAAQEYWTEAGKAYWQALANEPTPSQRAKTLQRMADAFQASGNPRGALAAGLQALEVNHALTLNRPELLEEGYAKVLERLRNAISEKPDDALLEEALSILAVASEDLGSGKPALDEVRGLAPLEMWAQAMAVRQ